MKETTFAREQANACVTTDFSHMSAAFSTTLILVRFGAFSSPLLETSHARVIDIACLTWQAPGAVVRLERASELNEQGGHSTSLQLGVGIELWHDLGGVWQRERDDLDLGRLGQRGGRRLGARGVHHLDFLVQDAQVLSDLFTLLHVDARFGL